MSPFTFNKTVSSVTSEIAAELCGISKSKLLALEKQAGITIPRDPKTQSRDRLFDLSTINQLRAFLNDPSIEVGQTITLRGGSTITIS